MKEALVPSPYTRPRLYQRTLTLCLLAAALLTTELVVVHETALRGTVLALSVARRRGKREEREYRAKKKGTVEVCAPSTLE